MKEKLRLTRQNQIFSWLHSKATIPTISNPLRKRKKNKSVYFFQLKIVLHICIWNKTSFIFHFCLYSEIKKIKDVVPKVFCPKCLWRKPASRQLTDLIEINMIKWNEKIVTNFFIIF